MELSLNHLLPGQQACIIACTACGELGCRLHGIGVVPGASVCCAGKNGNGQVTMIQINGACVRLQTRDLEKVRVMV